MGDNDKKIMDRIGEHLDRYQAQYSNDWIGIFLQGSQNYGLDYEGSDIDTKVIVLPKFDDIVLNQRPISTTLVMPNDEHVDVKDIRLMLDCFKKQNINFLEILFTKYYIINPKYKKDINFLLQNREMIARYNDYAAIHCMLGMVSEKRKALQKPHPSAQAVVEKYGYDGKQLHHMARIEEFFGKYAMGCSYQECLTSDKQEELISLKRHALDVAQAVEMADNIVSRMESAVERYKEKHSCATVNYLVDKLLRDALTSIMRISLISELHA